MPKKLVIGCLIVSIFLTGCASMRESWNHSLLNPNRHVNYLDATDWLDDHPTMKVATYAACAGCIVVAVAGLVVLDLYLENHPHQIDGQPTLQ